MSQRNLYEVFVGSLPRNIYTSKLYITTKVNEINNKSFTKTIFDYRYTSFRFKSEIGYNVYVTFKVYLMYECTLLVLIL